MTKWFTFSKSTSFHSLFSAHFMSKEIDRKFIFTPINYYTHLIFLLLIPHRVI